MSIPLNFALDGAEPVIRRGRIESLPDVMRFLVEFVLKVKRL